jgi:competence protein ComEC
MRWRPSILLTIAYGAGLATGLLHFGGPIGVAGVALGATALGRPLTALLGSGALLGRMSAEIALAVEKQRCNARLPAGRIRLRVRVLEPVDSIGGQLQLQPLRAGCDGPIPARWPAGRPTPAGIEARVLARWISRPGPGGRPGGTLVVTEISALERHSGILSQVRTALFVSSRKLYGVRAPMVDALVLGRRGGIDPELQNRFAQSGLVHLLSISGFHVGLISAWIFLFARLLRLSRPRSLILAALASTAYVAFLGWPAPATRAAALALLMARCHLRQRRVQADALLATTCLGVLLIDPWAVLDLGGWLSAAALWGATRFSGWSDRRLGETFWWRTLASSFGATIATAPITAYGLGTVALAGLALNFLAIPIAGFAVPGVVVSLLLESLLPGVARALAGGSGLALHALEVTASVGSTIPAGHVLVEPGSIQAGIPWFGALALATWIFAPRNTVAEAGRRTWWAVTGLLWVTLIPTLLASSGDGARLLTLHFLDVGQGDGALLRTPAGNWVMVDGGPVGERIDAGRRVMAPFLQRQGARRLSAVVVSHAHADHLGGIPSVLARMRTGEVLEPARLTPDPAYGRFLTELDSAHIPWHPARAGESFTLDSVTFTVLHPTPTWQGWGEDLNEDSVVLLVEYGAFQAVFAGDAGIPAEAEMRGRVKRVDLLKVGHHGSRGSTGDEWLDSLAPQLGVISVGRNDYGHPSPEALRRLAAHGVEIRRTDQDGDITVTTDGRQMTVRSARATTMYDVR